MRENIALWRAQICLKTSDACEDLGLSLVYMVAQEQLELLSPAERGMHGRLLNLQGVLHHQCGEHAAAFSLFSKALEQDRENEAALLNRAQLSRHLVRPSHRF